MALVSVALLMLLLGEPSLAALVEDWIVNPTPASSQPDDAGLPPEVQGGTPSPEDPGVPVEPGEVIQAWNNSSLKPAAQEAAKIPPQRPRDVMIVRDYGIFVFDTSRPAYAEVGDREAVSVFTVKFDGTVLLPSPGLIVERTEDRVVTRHEAVLLGRPPVPLGTQSFEAQYDFGMRILRRARAGEL